MTYGSMARFIYTAIAIFIFISTARAADNAGAIGLKSSNFQDYYYEAYEFSRTSSEAGIIAVKSTAFDSYLMVVKPDGSVLTNDDSRRDARGRFEGIEVGSNDAALLVGNAQEGRWLAVVTSASRKAAGDYALVYKGLADVKRIEARDIDAAKVSLAYAARGVIDPIAERKKRTDELVERITLPSFRAQLEQKLRTEISRLEVREDEKRSALSSLEGAERQLSKALADVDKLKESRDIVRGIVERDVKDVQSKIEGAASSQLQAQTNRRALEVALGELAQVNTIAISQKRLEMALLEATTATQIEELRKSIQIMRREFESIARPFIEKMLDSRALSYERLGMLGGSDFVMHAETAIATSKIAAIRSIKRDIESAPKAAYHAMKAIGPDDSRDIVTFGRDKLDSQRALDASVWLKEMMPWPPPTPSSRIVLNKWQLTDGARRPRTLGELDEQLQGALINAGYHGSSYWGVPGGFAMVTPLEQTSADGVPLDSSLRWQTSVVELKSFNLSEYFRALLTAPVGYFRVIVFVISSHPFASSHVREKLNVIEDWSRNGLNVLPPVVRAKVFSDAHDITVLVYEFQKRKREDKPEASVPGLISPEQHLINAKLSSLLNN